MHTYGIELVTFEKKEIPGSFLKLINVIFTNNGICIKTGYGTTEKCF